MTVHVFMLRVVGVTQMNARGSPLSNATCMGVAEKSERVVESDCIDVDDDVDTNCDFKTAMFWLQMSIMSSGGGVICWNDCRIK